MALSRKRNRELKRLRNSATELWDDQREVLEHASRVLREAGRQAGHVGREEIAPRVRDTYDHRIRPGVESGLAGARSVADTARTRLSHDVLPSIAGAVASTLAVIDVAKDARVKQALREIRRATDNTGRALEATTAKVGKAARRYTAKAVPMPAPKRRGPGRYIAIGVGVVALAGLGYAVWQTLRADDDLWISDDDSNEGALSL